MVLVIKSLCWKNAYVRLYTYRWANLGKGLVHIECYDFDFVRVKTQIVIGTKGLLKEPRRNRTQSLFSRLPVQLQL